MSPVPYLVRRSDYGCTMADSVPPSLRPSVPPSLPLPATLAQMGQHTTTAATAHWDMDMGDGSGGSAPGARSVLVVDTPGVRWFSLHGLDTRSIAHGCEDPPPPGPDLTATLSFKADPSPGPADSESCRVTYRAASRTVRT